MVTRLTLGFCFELLVECWHYLLKWGRQGGLVERIKVLDTQKGQICSLISEFGIKGWDYEQINKLWNCQSMPNIKSHRTGCKHLRRQCRYGRNEVKCLSFGPLLAQGLGLWAEAEKRDLRGAEVGYSEIDSCSLNMN